MQRHVAENLVKTLVAFAATVAFSVLPTVHSFHNHTETDDSHHQKALSAHTDTRETLGHHSGLWHKAAHQQCSICQVILGTKNKPFALQTGTIQLATAAASLGKISFGSEGSIAIQRHLTSHHCRAPPV